MCLFDVRARRGKRAPLCECRPWCRFPLRSGARGVEYRSASTGEKSARRIGPFGGLLFKSKEIVFFFWFFLRKCKKSTTFVLHFTHLTRKRQIMQMLYGHGTVRLWPMNLRSSSRMRRQFVCGTVRFPASAACRRNLRSLCGTPFVRPASALPRIAEACSLLPVEKAPLSHNLFFQDGRPADRDEKCIANPGPYTDRVPQYSDAH